jgi:phosphoglycerate dehydrogenase-like enzyme
MTTPIEVLITLPFSDELVNQLRGISPRLKITLSKARKTEEISDELWSRVEVLYTNNVIPDPEQAPLLRWIQFHWAGIDHVIDAPILTKPEVVATTLSGAAASKLAEYAVMMMLALGHRLPSLMANQKKAEWPSDRWERFTPQELSESTVGIVGYGSIGRQVARLLHTFGATILATKRDPMHPEDSGYIPDGQGDPSGDLVRRLYPPQAVRSMFRECDFVVITVPLTSETRNLIGAEELAVLKPNAFLIDISRGGVINLAALVSALKDNRIAGAALDVFPEEPLPSDHPLWKLPNVLITPHISGNTPCYDQRALALFSENLQRYLEGASLHNQLNPQRGY